MAHPKYAGSKGSNNPTAHTTSTRPTPTEPTSNADLGHSAQPAQEHPFTEAQVKEALGYDADDPNVKVTIRAVGGFPGVDAMEALLNTLGRVTADVTDAKENGDPGDHKAQAESVFNDVMREVADELQYAVKRHPTPFHSPHEGFAVLKEEVDELWDAIKTDSWFMRKEAIQVAAMAIRFLLDVDPE